MVEPGQAQGKKVVELDEGVSFVLCNTQKLSILHAIEARKHQFSGDRVTVCTSSFVQDGEPNDYPPQVTEDRISRIWAVRNPEKLRAWL